MADDFVNLVSQSNPAARYQQPQNAYPPPPAPYSDNLSPAMDPFFDDDDDLPDSAFGRPGPMHSQDSGLPLARNAAAPAGASKVTLPGNGVPQGFFDDDEYQVPGRTPFSGSSSFPGSKTSSEGRQKARRRKWKWRWPWQKEKVLMGERIIALNNEAANSDYGSNAVSTSKYNFASFLPKFLAGAYTTILCRLEVVADAHGP